jgi:hypothetical protein
MKWTELIRELRLRSEMPDKNIKFGTTVRYRGASGDLFMVLDTKPSEKKGDWTAWYKVIRLDTRNGSNLAQRSIGEITFVAQNAVDKVE